MGYFFKPVTHSLAYATSSRMFRATKAKEKACKDSALTAPALQTVSVLSQLQRTSAVLQYVARHLKPLKKHGI